MDSEVIEYEAKDGFDGRWYPVRILTGKVENGRVKIEWTHTGYISWVEQERVRVKQSTTQAEMSHVEMSPNYA